MHVIQYIYASMHPFNQNFNRGRESRPHGFGRNNNYNNGDRNLGYYGNADRFQMQNNSQYGNNTNMYCADMYENAQNRYQGDQNNFNPQRQFQNQQFRCNQTSQNDRQDTRQMELQRGRNFSGQFGHPNMQQNTGQFNSLLERQNCSLVGPRNSQAESFGERQSFPEFDSQRGRPYNSEFDCQRERQNPNFQNYERQDGQQGNRGRQFCNNAAAWELLRPNLLSMMERFLSSRSTSSNFNNDQQQPLGNFTPYMDQTAFQKVNSPNRYKKKWKKKKTKNHFSWENVTDKQNQSNQQLHVYSEFNKNVNDGSAQREDKKTGKSCTITSAEDVSDKTETTTPASGIVSDEIASIDHTPQVCSEEQKTTLKAIESEDGSDNSMCIVNSRNGSTTAQVDSKVLSKNEPSQNLPNEMQAELNPSVKEIQHNKVESPLGEHAGGTSGHTTQIDRSEVAHEVECPLGEHAGGTSGHTTQIDLSEVEHVQQGLELVSLEGDTQLSQDRETNTGSPQHAQILFTQPSSTEKNKSLSPGMKERMKQFFGVPIQKIGLGRGKDSPKTPEPGKTWSSNDYFTGAKSNDKQPSSDQAGSGPGQSTVSGIPDIDKKTPTSGNKDEDVMLGQRISVIGERNRPGERHSYRGASKFGVPKDGGVQQDRMWNQGRNLDVSNYREGNVDRRDMRLTPGREPNRGESTMKGGGVKTDKKPERNQMKSGDKCDDAKGRIASSQEVGLAYKDRFHPGDRSQYNNPNRTRDSQRYYGSPQNNSPRSQRDGRFDKNRGQHYRNSREEFEMGSRWHTENEYRKGRDTGNTFSPRDRNQGQFPSKSARPYSIGGYQNDYNDKPGRSLNRDLSGGSDWKAGEKRGNFDAASKLTNNPDIHYAQGDKIIPKSLNEPKEHSSQSSTSFQRTDQGATKSTMIDQDPNTGDSSLNESNCRTTEQKSDEARKQINNQGSMSSSNATGQKSDNEQDSQISKPGDNKKVEKEMEVSDYVSSSDDPEGQASSLQSSDKPKELSNKSSTTFQRTDQKHVTAATMMEEQTPNINSKDSSLNKSDRKTTEQKIDVTRTKSEGQRSMLGTTAIQQKSDDVHTSPVVEKFRGSKRAETDMDISGYASGSNDKCGQDVSTQNRTSEQQHIKALSKQRGADRQISGAPRSKEFGSVSVNKDKRQSIVPELSPKRQYSCEEESPRQMRHSSGSSQGRGSQRDNDHKVKNRHRNFSGESTHSSDTGRARSHSRDKESHVKRSHTSHRSDHKRAGEEKSSESNINSDSSSGGNRLHSHRHRHRQKGDNSNRHRHRSRGDSSPKSDNRHRHRSRGDSTPKSDKKEPSRQSSKEMGTSATGQSSDRLRDGDLSGLRHRKLGNATDRWKAEEDYAGGSDVDIDEEDSDDELETPFFLTSLTEASSRPIPSTPTKGINASYTESPTPSCSPQISLAPLSSLTSGFSLDALLAEAIDKTSEERQCEDMHAVLEEGLRKGGFVKDTLEVNEESVVEEDLLPEHQLKLKKFEIYKSQMSEVHPGESVFLAQRYLCLFNADISLQACGFVPGTTYIDKHLSTVQPGDYITLLTSDIMLMCFDAISCHDAVLQWLLFIMSVHPSHLLINGCYKTIQEHLYACQHFTCKTKYTWSPAVTDILSILCNYGADPNKLLPSSLMPNTDSVRKSLFHQQNMEIQPAAGKYNRENFRLVLSSLAMAFQIRPKYTTVQITQMVVMLCKAALDKSLNNFMLTHEFEVVLASLLKLYTDTDWTSQSLILCRKLSCLTEHHHNKVYLAQILPPTTKGNFLQRRVSFLMIHNLFYPEQKISDDIIIHFQLGRVHNVLPRLQGLADEDIYLLASCVSLLDLCIGNGIIKSAEKDDLEYITEQIRKLTGEVRDNVQMLDKTRIKDMMIRITSKWTLVLRSIGSKQRTLFECHGNFRKSPAEMKIETVDASQTDQASETEEEDSEEEDGHSEEEESVKQQAKVKTVTIDVNGKDASDSAAEEKMEIGDDDDLPEL